MVACAIVGQTAIDTVVRAAVVLLSTVSIIYDNRENCMIFFYFSQRRQSEDEALEDARSQFYKYAMYN